MELEEQTRREVAHRAARKQHDVDDDDQKNRSQAKRSKQARETRESKPRIGVKEKNQTSRAGDGGRSQRTTRKSRVA